MFKPTTGAIALLITALLLSKQSHGQIKPFIIAVTSNQNVYKTKDRLQVTRVYDLEAQRVADKETFVIIPVAIPFIRYRVVKTEGDATYIRILPRLKFDGKNILKADETNPGDDDPNGYIFKISDSDMTSGKKYLAAEKLIGMPLTMPFKLRKDADGKQIQFSPSLAYSFGYRIRLNNNPYRDHYANLVPIGISLNADKYKSEATPAEVDSFSMTYWLAGLSFEIKGLNIGFFTGRDRMFGDRKDWIYQKQRWYSLGLGYKFGG